jgi:hypothetical protein
VVLTTWYDKADEVWIRPSALSGPDDPILVELAAIAGESRASGVHAVQDILGTAVEHLLRVGTADGFAGCAHDPSQSTPDLVAEVAKTLELDPDAAALYLQLLALPDPTDRNVARWTGWKPARLKAARAALAEADLVVTAKRARAGRTLFLPGGWNELKRALPLETWKDGLYPVQDGWPNIPTTPVTDLFQAAWDRVKSGDTPGFEELQTRTTRRGRRR